MFYSTEPDFQITDFLHLVQDRRFPPHFNFDGEKHNFWEIVYVLDGKIEVTEDEKVYILGERDIVFHAPDEFHRIRSAQNTSPRVINISFRVKGELPKLLESGVIHFTSSQHDEFIEIILKLQEWKSLLESATEKSVSLFEISCRLSAFFMRLMRESTTKKSFSTSAGARTYSTLVEMMHREVYSNLSLEDFANKNYISVSYLKKLFTHYAGISPKSYYINLRISEAEKLLLSDISISDIAEKMNFSSPAYFTLFFKNHTGCTPMQYRKSHG